MYLLYLFVNNYLGMCTHTSLGNLFLVIYEYMLVMCSPYWTDRFYALLLA